MWITALEPGIDGGRVAVLGGVVEVDGGVVDVEGGVVTLDGGVVVVDGGTVVEGAPGFAGALTAGVLEPPPPLQATSAAASANATPKVTSRACRMLEW